MARNRPNPLDTKEEKAGQEENSGLDFSKVADTSKVKNDSNNKSKSVIDSALDELENNQEEVFYRGYYLEKEVFKALEDAVNKKSRGRRKLKGFKSFVVNRLLEAQLREEGFLDNKDT